MHATIRKIHPQDNPYIAALIRQVLIEHDAPKVGTAYADASLDRLSEVYDIPNSVYYIVEALGKVLGGCGIAPLENGDANICELQKMYFSPEARGTGLAAQLLQKCLDAAKGFGYSQCYLETLPNMEAAQKLYAKFGFTYLDAPLGNTGHNSCPVWMIKNLV
ncbi:acetyltransferase [Flavobacterium rivuli WB 3.3-2 = DSM 21788]|uniref:Acetyltransferase n=1 Tax=Flavobacterium rivuli WB 3.3-2 = DSM 21788 TaxID=1121895 RepID=A0A0A2LZS3_9FLAO|nr:GNAT family N-acetyltransferase [Flavobacterium rivuli]KGO84678.1 acetyltransferase [Flavobacterium rivuli WB 3.3-2 = DSM 21788]